MTMCAPIGVWQGNIEHLTEESNFQFWKLKWHVSLTTTLQTRGLPCLLWFYKFWKIRCIHTLIFFGSMWNFRRLPLQHLFIFCWKPWLEQIRYLTGFPCRCLLLNNGESSAILPITFESPIKAYAPESAVSSFPWTAWTPGTDRAKHKNNISAQL